MNHQSRLVTWLVLAAIIAIAFFWGLGAAGITDLDEGLYVGCSRGMAVTGDLVTPRINGVPFYEKPPMLYWLGAGAMRLLGENNAAPRIPSALAAMLTVLLVYQLGAWRFGRMAGLLAAAAFALCPMSLAAGRLATTDALLDLFVASAVACFAGARWGAPVRRRWYQVGMWTACGLGLLTKGSPGLALPLMAIGLFLLVLHRWRVGPAWSDLAATVPLYGILWSFAIAAPWHVAAWHANGAAFVDEYFVRQQLGRFRGGDVSHHGPIWFFVPALIAGMFPWSVFLPQALASLRTSRAPAEEPRDDFAVLLACWAAVVFTIFSLSGSKLVSYILPMYPPCALLIGRWCMRMAGERGRPWGPVVAGMLGAVVAALAYLAVRFPGPVTGLVGRYADRPVTPPQVPAELLQAAAWLALAGAAGSAAFVALSLAGRKKAALACMGVGTAAFVAIAVTRALPAADRQFWHPLHRMVGAAGRMASTGSGLLIVVGPPRRPSVLYYVPERLLAARNPGLLLETTDIGAARAYLATHPHAVVVTTPSRAVELGVARVLDRDGALVTATAR